jgi:hypothetical protein
MGPQAHSESSSKCGVSRIASGLSVEDNRHGPVVDELEHHPGPEDPAFNGHGFLGERRAEPLVERVRLLGWRGLNEAGPSRRAPRLRR